MAGTDILIDDHPLGLGELRRALAGPVAATLGPKARGRIEKSREIVAKLLKGSKPIYGVNTGFGRLAQKRIGNEDLATLQRNIVRSHAAGTGQPLPPAVVRLILLLKAKSLAAGHSGVRVEVVEALLKLLASDILPVIPAQGSVGASGDLAPLAHLSLVLIGEGEALSGSQVLSGGAALQKAGLAPLELGPKEGLALLNGTQVSTALALAGLLEAERSMQAAVVAGALSVDAIAGSDAPFDPRIHALRPHAGQKLLAAHYRRLLAGSGIRASHVDCERVQDPYSFRCQPQVMGAALDLLAQVSRTLLVEANAVTDNPLVFGAEEGEEEAAVLSGGNFHAEPVAFAADILALAIAEVGAISERRISALIDTTISELPPFLTANPGLNSGYMLAQVTASALASENKQRAHPASVDSLPTSANQEDHVSMATHAGTRLGPMNDNTRGIVAIELLSAAEGIEFRRPLKSSEALEQAMSALRAEVPARPEDRAFAPDIEAARRLIGTDAFSPLVGDLLADEGGIAAP